MKKNVSENIIQIKNLSFFYDKKEIFHNLSLDINRGNWVTIVGNNGSGKTTLISLILGKLDYEGQIIINTKNIGVLPNKMKYKNLNEQINKLENKEEIINTFSIKKISNLNYDDLNKNEKKYALFISTLINNPDVLLLDNFLDEMEYKYKEKIIKMLKKFQKKGMTIVNLSQRMDDSLLGDEIMIMEKGEVVLNDKKEEIFNDEKKFKNLKLNLPFIIDLSIKLKYYRLVDRLYFNDEDLVDAIWK